MHADPFLLDKDYADFVPGVSRLKFTTLDAPNAWSIWLGCIGFGYLGGSGIVFLGIVLVTLFNLTVSASAALSPDTPRTLLVFGSLGIFGLGFGIFVILLIRRALRAQFAYRRLNSRGMLLDGTVVETKNAVRRTRFSSYRYVDVTYQFVTPDGRTLTRKLSAYRPDLPSGLPPKGRAVRVLYADDNAVVML